ncbi:phosphoribosylanthranilate isomerase [Bacillus sp. MRMR6]|uniref:phosphoribosylanthranilate isomerase n=1 Tax=Bacillus sp. MRMR6 TaxID=1928617 RepID=UPI0009526E3D|nr:phosphoribosylanthranilate isomerase [Bacillus sp. MRMR6]OLS34372.1 N-(5'-phosphoribosyl)anthranilate isomerase [Bacillus sp. MRMR6]
MKVKICGITDEGTASAAVAFGADALGFVFAESKRYVEPEIAQAIVAQLPKNVLKVGVFVNETKEKIEEIAERVGLTHIQLHGDESPEFCGSIKLPVIKAMSIEEDDHQLAIETFPCDYILLDGPKGKYRGGNGMAFNWTTVQSRNFQGKKIILAGGLNVENIESAVRLVKPYMVDVSSGVETDGVKDLKKIETFLNKAKASRTGGIN